MSTEKTQTYRTFDGEQHTRTFRLTHHEGWSSILKVAVDGKSVQNKWGGYTARNVGQRAYIERIWRSL
jgi:hypothetical protein